MKKRLVILLSITISGLSAQTITAYNLDISEITVSPAGKEVKGMAVNGSIPGPVLTFTEGDSAVIHVTNHMDVETSVHWHGILLPNFQDGVPYLTTPPIRPGETFTYRFRLKQSGTYWYHSHTMLQEQRGVFGSIVIKPKQQKLGYDKDVVLVLSDWTNQKPKKVMQSLKRGLEYYGIKKGTSIPLSRVISRKALGAQLSFWRQRMEGADIADIWYPAFLSNGSQVAAFSEIEKGEKVRLRIINASASTQFWMTFGGEAPLLISSDGMDVDPVTRNKTFIAIAETYDFIIEVPKGATMEMRAMAQDGSGVTKSYFGNGTDTLKAKVLDRPDKIAMMQQMSQMDMRMGAPAMKWNPSKEEPEKMMDDWGMQMSGMDYMEMGTSTKHNDVNHKMGGVSDQEHMAMSMKTMPDSMKDGVQMDMFAEYNYDYLKSPKPTNFNDSIKVKNVLLNLTGNMWRYIWSMNGVPLSEADKIEVKKGEVMRITLNNLTMMHHPMHLHGHFFRVINANGEYSPLKHTINVAPMQKVTIEFAASESGDWFFHCHVLYHMMSGMARVYSYGTSRDPRMANYPLKKLLKEGQHFYSWGQVEARTQMTEFSLVSSNTRNQFNVTAEFGYDLTGEAEVTYERYLYDYFRVFAGVNAENEIPDSLGKAETTAIVGVRWLTPYMFNLDFRVDNKLRPEIRLNREVLLFPRTFLYGEFEYQMDFGITEDLKDEETSETVSYISNMQWQLGLEYLLNSTFSLSVNYNNQFGAGAGLVLRF